VKLANDSHYSIFGLWSLTFGLWLLAMLESSIATNTKTKVPRPKTSEISDYKFQILAKVFR
jgi:hypothetical protein